MTEISYVNLGADEYDRGKTILNKARHPGFIGRELFYRCATSGVVCVAVVDGVDYGIAMITKGRLQALSVIQAAQGKGIGQGLMRHLRPDLRQDLVLRALRLQAIWRRESRAKRQTCDATHAT